MFLNKNNTCLMIKFLTGINISILKELMINNNKVFFLIKLNTKKESNQLAQESLYPLCCEHRGKSIKSQFSSSGASVWCCHGNAAAIEYRVTLPRLNPFERPNMPKMGENRRNRLQRTILEPF